jgi:hypothetical protein
LLDRADRAILTELQNEGDPRTVELARRIHLSTPATHTRLRRLRAHGPGRVWLLKFRRAARRPPGAPLARLNMPRQSFLPVAPGSDFTLENLPYGIVRPKRGGASRRGGPWRICAGFERD